jgi:sugar lactone lactonase YvrE
MKLPRSFGCHIFLKLPLYIVVATIQAQNYSLQTLIGGPLVTEGSSALSAGLRYPNAVASDSSGNLFIVDREDNRIWKVDPTGAFTIYAGNGTQAYSGDHGSASQASLKHPTGVAPDGTGAVYICDSGNHLVPRVGPDGTITTAAGNGIAGHTGDNGPARKAQITLQAIAIDPSGNLLIADGRRVPQVSATTGNITTIAGTGAVGYSGDGGQATKAKLDNVAGIAADAAGFAISIPKG